ncbi:VOC family protein [Mucilaginibacter sp.]|uniref:VOC family protein n=1 Tax=Mucilaginibacter sp. TaxID=1882438 RepID=UPI00262ED00D|nr:VOC family protein [Mucilaginibacter sp.]
MGNTEEAMNFYKSLFGGEFESFIRYSDVAGGEKMSPPDQQKIMHLSLPIAGDQMIMATDTLESMGRKVVFGNNYHISLEAESEAEVDKIFNGLSAGGTVEMPLNKTFWGAYFGMCEDKFGVQWMINYTYPQKK